jgi:hypothetical protein
MAQLSDMGVAISAVTLTASSLSVIGSGFILVCYRILPVKYHIRHVLILNLAVADFINSLTTSIGGIDILVRRKSLTASTACIVQGFAVQTTLQGTDCAVLAIAIATVFLITRSAKGSCVDDELEDRQIALWTCAIWILPLFTGLLSLGMGWYAPATGNWCWIKEKPTYLRYALTHGWRILFIVTEICLYVYLYIWIRRYFKRLRTDAVAIYPSGALITQGTTCREIRTGTSSSRFIQATGMKAPGHFPQLSLSHMIGLRQNRPSNFWTENPRYQAIRKMLLLNSYPMAYVILWIPGIANQVIEATGHESSVMQLLQASTQLVGLADALAYGWNEKAGTQVLGYFRSKKQSGDWYNGLGG